MIHKHRKRLHRVDFQVTLLTSGIVILSFFVLHFFSYHITYDDMIYGLEEQANSIYNYVQTSLDPDTFYGIEDKVDMDSTTYQEMKENLSKVKEATGVMYLYTAKKTAEGNYIYLVDGLPSDSSDFRYPGDLIETEVITEMEKAYTGEIILPDDIMHTTWGNIFVSYFPIFDNEEVIGVLGIEFPAEHQYNTYASIRIGTPIIAVFACLITSFIAVIVFKRISNPTYRDMYNTDFLTDLKNRNAFEIDIDNLNQRNSYMEMAIMVLDLNDLKKINDELGHQSGDQYIQKVACILHEVMSDIAPVYRIGGDEFTIIIDHATDEKLANYVEQIQKMIDKENEQHKMKVSISIGYAIYDASLDKDFNDTYHRGDSDMYEQKRISKGKDRSDSNATS